MTRACCDYCFKLDFNECVLLAGCWNRPGGPITCDDLLFDNEADRVRLIGETLYPNHGYFAELKAKRERNR